MILTLKPNRFLPVASIIGIIAIICLLMLFRHLAIESIVDHENRSNVEITHLLSDLIAHKYRDLLEVGSSEVERQRSGLPAIVRLDFELRRLMQGSRLVKVKIYNLDGLTIFSTDPTQIAEKKQGNSGFLTARSGRATSNITFRDQFDRFEQVLSNINVVSSYIPLHNSDTGDVEAVFELYSDVTDLVSKLERTQWLVVIGVLGSVSLLYLLLIVAARRADRVEEKRQRDRRNSEAQILYQATHDALTGLVNRHEFERLVDHLIEDLDYAEDSHALCFMDLDQFKIVNDTSGHIAGDELLRQLGDLLRDTVRSGDILARIGGDEFGILLKSCSQDKALEVANGLLYALQDFQFFWEGKSFRIGASIGLAFISRSNTSLIEVLRQADAARNLAKDSGRNQVQEYREGDTEMSLRQGEMQWVSRIDQALEDGRYRLYAQEIEALNGGGRNRHYELLIRMINEDGQVVAPDAFLPAAERFDRIIKVDDWVVSNGLQIMADNPQFVAQIDYLAFNLSGQSVTNDEFLNQVTSTIDRFGIDPAKLCFEITETVAISNLRAATRFITALRDIGCRFALDDFGSGLSSFGYLKSLPVDFLKIDGMFVRDIEDDPIYRAMVKSISDIGHVMQKQTIAECVENEAIRKQIIDLGIDYAQGYGIGVPEPLSNLIERSNNSKKAS